MSIPTARIQGYYEEGNEELLRAEFYLLKEEWIEVIVRNEIYRKRIRRGYNRRGRSWDFQVEDMVLRKVT